MFLDPDTFPQFPFMEITHLNFVVNRNICSVHPQRSLNGVLIWVILHEIKSMYDAPGGEFSESIKATSQRQHDIKAQ